MPRFTHIPTGAVVEVDEERAKLLDADYEPVRETATAKKAAAKKSSK